MKINQLKIYESVTIKWHLQLLLLVLKVYDNSHEKYTSNF